MNAPTRRLLICVAVPTISAAIAVFWRAARPHKPGRAALTGAHVKLPDKAFTHPPEKPHDPAADYFEFGQLEHFYRVPGEFTHRLIGDQYGFESLSFFITETHPGGGPGFHVHDTEEAHVLLEGSAQYRIGDKAFTVDAPYVAKVPAGVPHTFINIGSKPFNLIVVFASKHPNTTRIGPNPLILARQNREEPRPGCMP
jgi:mannose-6-phosphate isomerase-like protein (cupin superfamily)